MMNYFLTWLTEESALKTFTQPANHRRLSLFQTPCALRAGFEAVQNLYFDSLERSCAIAIHKTTPATS